jgi:Major Facilitator Superfamily
MAILLLIRIWIANLARTHCEFRWRCHAAQSLSCLRSLLLEDPMEGPRVRLRLRQGSGGIPTRNLWVRPALIGRPRGRRRRVTNLGRPVARDTELGAVNLGVLPYVVAAAHFMEYLDTTVISTVLPQMARSFSVEPNEVGLGMTAHMLTPAVFIPISGWIADHFGSRTVFGGALAVFIVASVLCGFSTGLAFFPLRRLQKSSEH